MQSLTLQKRRLQGHSEVNRKIENLDLRSARAQASSWETCKFIGVKLEGSDFQGSNFLSCTFEKCDARLINLSLTRFTNCEFVDTDFSQANFSWSVFHENLFSRCNFSYASFADSTMRKLQDFVHCNFHGADLSFIETEGPGLFGCNLWGAKIPWGCQVFQGKMSEETIRLGLALLANTCQEMSQDLKVKIRALAGDSAVGVVGRLMKERQDVNDKSS